MKILLANKFYYPRGGDCIYTIGLEKLLKDKGHDVAVFSMQHPSNRASEYSSYFPSHIDFNKRSLRSFISLLVRPFGSSEVSVKFTRLINDFKPDIVHLNNIHSQLSPVIALISHKYNIPVVWTLHDYKLICPAYLLLSNGKPCVACLDNKWSVVKKRCIKNNWLASLVAYWEARYWNSSRLSEITDRFISPSNFLKEKMMAGGINPAKIETLHNFIDISSHKVTTEADSNYYCYVGRLSSEKGIETLLKAASGLPGFKLNIIGTGPLEELLISGNRLDHVEFLGYRTGSELNSIISRARFLVIPSEVYENNPLTVLEALSLGVPVLGSNMGGIPELVNPGLNGLLFESGNVMDLQEKITYMWQNSEEFNRDAIAKDAQSNSNANNYYDKLFHIYKSVIERINQ
ncbi:MAG: glycosyltransferase [Bacteroidales bacterium]|nr:glycosyltransferase [Bacteroidales bacterium]